jgi:hypothetical protein
MTAVTSAKKASAQHVRIAKALFDSLKKQPWLRGVGLAEKNGRVALSLGVDPKKVSDEDDFPGFFQGLQVILIMGDSSSTGRPTIRN